MSDSDVTSPTLYRHKAFLAICAVAIGISSFLIGKLYTTIHDQQEISDLHAKLYMSENFLNNGKPLYLSALHVSSSLSNYAIYPGLVFRTRASCIDDIRAQAILHTGDDQVFSCIPTPAMP
jgi:hypothetical protein